MSKRKGAADVLAEVDDSKKFKEDTPSEKAKGGEFSGSITNQLKYLQIIVTGHKGCGKSCLVLSYVEQQFPPRGVDFLSKQYLHFLPESDETIMIWDLDTRAEYSEYRQQSYQEADIALLCFDIKKGLVEGKELETLLQQWIAELDEHCENIPIILVGLKADLRFDCKANLFSEDEIKTAMGRYPRIKIYREVSAYENRNDVQELFKEAVTSIGSKKRKVMFSQCGYRIFQFRWLI